MTTDVLFVGPHEEIASLDDRRRSTMQDTMMDGGMMWGMGVVGWLVLLVLLLVAAALIKYLFFK